MGGREEKRKGERENNTWARGVIEFIFECNLIYYIDASVLLENNQ